MTAKMQVQDEKVKWKNSKCLFLRKNCWESRENPLDSSGIFSQDFRHRRFFRKIQDDLRERNIKPEHFVDRTIFMSMFNDIDWTREGHDGICISNSEKSQGLREEILARTLDVPRSSR